MDRTWGWVLQDSGAQTSDPVAESAEFWIRRVALDPAGTVTRWEPRLASSHWFEAYDVLDAMQRSPEAARWFCKHRKADLRAALRHPRSPIRAAAWRIVRMGQGAGADCVDWTVPIAREFGDEASAWRNAALSQAWLDSGAAGAAAYDSVLEDLARGGAESLGTNPDGYRAAAMHLGVAQERTADSLWIAESGGSGKLRPIYPGFLRLMAHPRAIENVRELVRRSSPEVRFHVEALALSQQAFAGTLNAEPDAIDWSVLEQGLLDAPPVGDEWEVQFYMWNQVQSELARLGSSRLSQIYWAIGLNVSSKLSAQAVRSFGGMDEAREHYIRFATESAPPEVALKRAEGESRAIQELVWIGLEGDWRAIPLSALAPWIRGEHGKDFQVLAVSRLCESPVGDERQKLLLEVVESGEGEALRLAFRTLAQGPDPAAVQERLHRIWREEGPNSRQSLLRELPNSEAWRAFGGDWLELVREPGPCDLLVLEHLSFLATDARWRALFERDLAEALEARFVDWQAGREPVSRDLARRAAALRRVQTAGGRESAPALEANPLTRGLTRRADWILGLPEASQADVRFDYSKACVALIADAPGFAAWVQGDLHRIQKWPRRLRVEVALRLPSHSYADPDSDLRRFVDGVGAADYSHLGAVLKERWLSDAQRAGRRLFEEATNRRASSNLRQVALAGLARLGEVEAILQVMNEDIGITGPQLAMEALQPLQDVRIDPALRARWMRARAAGLGKGANQEIEAHLATELLLVLVGRGALDMGEASSILEAPFLASVDQWNQRLGGASVEEDWRSQRRVLHRVAQRGDLLPLLELNPDWMAMDGRLLAKLAQDAHSAGDPESANLLARWAEVALAGEPDKNQWRNAMAEVHILRFRLARSRRDLANVAWYCDRFVEGMLAGGVSIEPLVGGFDVREGRHPLARL
ncbi:MAG: hypothetical protein P1V35_13090, partial [Planctomycetota bacterium]|nr:hypothetical protein [Planctomycetota bacterium]